MNNIGSYRGDNDKRISQNVASTPAKAATTSEAASVAQGTLSALTGQSATPGLSVPPASNLSPLLEETKEQAIKNRDGHLWQCVDRIPVAEGFIYKFRLRKEYDVTEPSSLTGVSWNSVAERKVDNKNFEIFPAIEREAKHLTDFHKWEWHTAELGIMKRKLMNGEIKTVPVPIWNDQVNKILMEVGYKFEITKNGITLDLPDEKVLESRWNKMVDDHPERQLHKLIILSSRDVAGDTEFTKAFIDKKLILSTGSEFAHDHQVHILAALRWMILDPKNYSVVHEKYSEICPGLVEQIKKARELIEEKKLKSDPQNAQEKEYYKRFEKNMVLADTIPSIVADVLASGEDPFPLEYLDMRKPLSFWNSSIRNFDNFINNRYAKEISDKYKKEHKGAEIPPTELAAQIEGISLKWFFKELVKALGQEVAL